jgi:hypothetical protein
MAIHLPGGRYSPSADSWTPTNANKTASAREFFTSVWTGAEMIVWGGDDRFVTETNTGARYNRRLITGNQPRRRARQPPGICIQRFGPEVR